MRDRAPWTSRRDGLPPPAKGPVRSSRGDRRGGRDTGIRDRDEEEGFVGAGGLLQSVHRGHESVTLGQEPPVEGVWCTGQAMTHTVEQLVDIAHSYHPQDGAAGEGAAEVRRRTEAHERACARFADWVSMLRRLGDRFPGHAVENRSIFRQSPRTSVYDLAYSGSLEVPITRDDESYRYIGFMASIVVPYYVVHDLARLSSGEDHWRIRFVTGEHEREIAGEISRELESTFKGCSRMPEEVGKVVVPGVRTSVRRPGEATIHDGLFSDDW